MMKEVTDGGGSEWGVENYSREIDMLDPLDK
jgi:hypothetical protein